MLVHANGAGCGRLAKPPTASNGVIHAVGVFFLLGTECLSDGRSNPIENKAAAVRACLGPSETQALPPWGNRQTGQERRKDGRKVGWG